MTFRHFDLYAQAIAKIERDHEMDRKDVAEMIGRGLVERTRLREYFEAVAPDLYRLPPRSIPLRSGVRSRP